MRMIVPKRAKDTAQEFEGRHRTVSKTVTLALQKEGMRRRTRSDRSRSGFAGVQQARRSNCAGCDADEQTNRQEVCLLDPKKLKDNGFEDDRHNARDYDNDNDDRVVALDPLDLGDGERRGREATDKGEGRGGGELEGETAQRPNEDGKDGRRQDEEEHPEELAARTRVWVSTNHGGKR